MHADDPMERSLLKKLKVDVAFPADDPGILDRMPGQGGDVEKIVWPMKTVRRNIRGGRRGRRCSFRRRLGDMLCGIGGLLRRGMRLSCQRRQRGSSN
jgi:hypothetical protein